MSHSRRPNESPNVRLPVTLPDLSEPRALLFDLDGTLVDTVALRVAAWLAAFGRFDIPVDRELLPAYMGSDGRWLAREVARAAGREIDWATSDEIDRLSGSLFDELNSAPQPLPGATELLTALEGEGLTFCIATASQPGQVEANVKALGLPAPPAIVDASHVENAKPEPDLLLAAAAQLGVAPGGCWYVGDSAWDMMASIRAGTVAVAVTTGATSAEALLSAGAAVVVPGLPALAAELRRRGLLR
ncbi:MAG TPA: HAD family phosphatase [Candidatus Limnocylindrales bacterium]|jgi:haloacid dehalogenase superfamily, subfamily IA, variant 3 with third motif having DD or ED|nr:HAD family phosphatase [Candidatus Limnocylindrales bacterium]